MGSINILKVSPDHISLCRSQFGFLHSVFLRWHWKIGLHQMEWSPSNHIRFSFMFFNVNDLFYHFQVHLWHWDWNRYSFVSNLHVINYSQSGTFLNFNKVKSILGFRMSFHFYFSMVTPLLSSLENSFIFNLHTWYICFVWALKERTIKFTIFMGS